METGYHYLVKSSTLVLQPQLWQLVYLKCKLLLFYSIPIGG